MKIEFKMTEDLEDKTLDFYLNKSFIFWYCMRDKKYYQRVIPTNLVNTIRRLNK
jgi:hypothetical protein